MKIRLADPLPVSASFRISRSGMEIMRHLACLRQRFHCTLQPSWKRARLAMPCHAPRAANQGRASSSPSCALRMFSIPARLDSRFPTGFNINSCRQTGLKYCRWEQVSVGRIGLGLVYSIAGHILSSCFLIPPLWPLCRIVVFEDHSSGVG